MPPLCYAAPLIARILLLKESASETAIMPRYDEPMQCDGLSSRSSRSHSAEIFISGMKVGGANRFAAEAIYWRKKSLGHKNFLFLAEICSFRASRRGRRQRRDGCGFALIFINERLATAAAALVAVTDVGTKKRGKIFQRPVATRDAVRFFDSFRCASLPTAPPPPPPLHFPIS